MAVLSLPAAKACQVCGESFQPRAGNQVNCSKRCRLELSARNRKNQKPGYHRQAYLLREYRLTVADFDGMVRAQGGRCAICERIPSGDGHLGRLFVDHDHSTGRVRALLCAHCNSALGQLFDQPNLALAAAAYLIQHQGA